MCPTGYPKAMNSYKLRSVSRLVYECAICRKYLTVIQREIEEEGDSTNQMSIFSEWKRRVGVGWAWQVWFNEVQQRARASMKSIAELTHWHVGLFTFWHFLCTIKHQRYVSQHRLIPGATELPPSISIQNISSGFTSVSFSAVYVLCCARVCTQWVCWGSCWLTSGKDRGCRAPAHRWKSRKKPGLNMPPPLSPPSSHSLSPPSVTPSFSGICLSLLAATNQLGLINICLNVACFRSKINCHWFNIWGVYAITVNVAFAVWKGVVHHTFLLSSQAMVMQAVLSKEANYQQGRGYNFTTVCAGKLS